MKAMKAVGGIAALVLVAGGAFWAGRTTLKSPDAVEKAEPSSVTVKVVEQQVGRVLTLATSVRRATTPLAVNRLSGVVTSVGKDGDAKAGSILYSVNRRAVRVVAGGTPFYRDLQDGASGPDVKQLQQALVATGAKLEADGTWGSSTTQAVKKWQTDAGEEATGTMPLGEVVAVPKLPIPVQFDRSVLWPGAQLSGGEALLKTTSGQPSFAMEVTRAQEKLVPVGTTVRVKNGDITWEGVTGDPVPSKSGNGLNELPVTTASGGLLCGNQCDTLPAGGETSLLTDVVVIPPVTGPVVPVAAITTQPDGSTSVTVVKSGGDTTQKVTVKGVSDGLAVVDGVKVGDEVRVFGKPTPTSQETPK